MRKEPIPLTLAYAGYPTCHSIAADQSGCSVREHGAADCVLVVEASALASRTGSSTLTSFLRRHPGLPAVIVAIGEAAPVARAEIGEPHRILLDEIGQRLGQSPLRTPSTERLALKIGLDFHWEELES